MFQFFKEAVLNSPAVLITSIVLLIVQSITIFDIRILQAKRTGTLPPDHPELPKWTRSFHMIEWVLRIILLILNWKFALAYFVLLFILKVVPVLETIGNILMVPFKPRDSRKLRQQYGEQRGGGDGIPPPHR